MAKDKVQNYQQQSEIFLKRTYQKVGNYRLPAAGCSSHTVIYQYFKKERGYIICSSGKPLTHLYHTCLEISHSKQNEANVCFKSVKTYVDFGFRERNFYELLIFYRGEDLQAMFANHELLLIENKVIVY